jgi:hypothetical protein
MDEVAQAIITHLCIVLYLESNNNLDQTFINETS